MQKSKQISNLKMILFITISNILIISDVSFHYFLSTYKHTSYIVLIIYILITLCLSLLFKGYSSKSNILKKVSKNKMKYIILLYLFIYITTFSYLVLIIIKDKYYKDINFYVLSFLFLLTIVYCSKQTFTNIINISMIFFVFIIFFYLISFTHIDGRSFNLLLPISLDIKTIYKAFIILLFPFDNIIYSLVSIYMKDGFNKKVYVTGNILQLIYLLIIFIDSITLLGANYFINVKYGSFIRWEVYQGNKFIENFDVFLFIIMITTVIFKLSSYINIMNLICKRKINNYLLFTLFFIIISIFYIYINYSTKILEFIILFLFILSFLIYIYFVKESFKEKIVMRNTYGK